MFMMTSNDVRTWHFGIIVFVIQSVLASMILTTQVIYVESGVPLDSPIKVSIFVSIAQFFGLLLTIFWQSDILTSVRMLNMLWYDRNGNWPYEAIHAKNGNFWTWADKVLLPNMLRLVEGLLVLATSFAIIVKSDDIIDLFKDFTALILISEIDNIAFRLASRRYFGKRMRKEADRIGQIRLVDDSDARVFCIPMRLFAVLLIFTTMVGGWSYFVHGQRSGKFLKIRYPDCQVKNHSLIKDTKCHNFGDYNTKECGYDGGDCDSFNQEFPSCTAKEPSIFLGSGSCMNAKPYNTEECGWDGGDCIEFNEKYPNCSAKYPIRIGDGNCDGENYNTEECDWDGGDCK